LQCTKCSAEYPIVRGIPRFVPAENYTDNFGLQWNTFAKTQLDSYTGSEVSRRRFCGYTGWSEQDISGQLVLDAGCGAGRFAEVALSLGARDIAVDFSSAIDAARKNLEGKGDIEFVQADINALPFAPESFGHVYCLGVIQHTPDPTRSFRDLAAVTAPAGRLAVDVYPKVWRNAASAKYWIRPLTKRMSPETTLRVVERLFPILYPISAAVDRIPVVGHYLKWMIPVAQYQGVHPDLTDEHARAWALLDTFDMWAPAYDRPQSKRTIRKWFEDNGFLDVEVFRKGFYIGRGVKRSAA
jgi:ubiquinone/menaquinone biosynthesis C-methylase UbiE